MDESELERLILAEYPYPIAVAYRRVLNAADWPLKRDLAYKLFDLVLRTFVLGIVNRYSLHDVQQISDSRLNQLIVEYLPRATLGRWKDALFTAARAYAGHRELFPFPELYDLYFNTAREPHRLRRGIQAAYDRLIEVRNETHLLYAPETEEEWETSGRQVMDDLRTVLAHFAFLEHYDLIHITERHGNVYRYVVYTGESPRDPDRPLQSQEPLQPGWFYLLRESGELLQLHPFFLYREDPGVVSVGDVLPSDAAIYHTFSETVVSYLAVVLRKEFKDREELRALVQNLYQEIRRLEQQRRTAERLTWDLTREIAGEISRARFTDVRSDYHVERYQQRQTVEQAFDDFLASDKVCFVVLGRSGVGKSSFLLALADRSESDRDSCLLMYNGASLETDRKLTEIINYDCQEHFQLITRDGQPLPIHFLQAISLLEGIEGRQVLLTIDAINENATARTLLMRINELAAVAAEHFPWLKIVITCRPEAWRAIKRRQPPNEALYYRPVKAPEVGVEMRPFSRDELPGAYDKYRQWYRLQTPFADIPAATCRLLEDPLTLRVVAETYSGQSLPEVVRPGEIYERYAEKLVREGRMERYALTFLERDLLPLMLSEGHYENRITADQVNTAVTSTGKEILELIVNDAVVSDGRRVNQSFEDLANAEILVREGTVLNEEIRFAYERFYDYYGGKRIYQLADAHDDRAAYFLSMIEKTSERPFLWGPVRAALVREGKVHGTRLLVDLCAVQQQRVQDMLVAALTDLGRDVPDSVTGALEEIMPPPGEPSAVKRAWRVARPADERHDKQTRTAKTIAIEVASSLEIPWVLQRGALDADPAVRAASAQYTFHLWERNRQGGFTVLDYVASRVMRGVMPDLPAFDFTLGLSFLIFFGNSHDSDVLERLRAAWQPIIARLLLYKESAGPVSRRMRGMVRDRIYSFAIARTFHLIEQMPKYNPVNYDDLAAFFSLPQEPKELYLRLVRYLDLDAGYPREVMERDWLQTVTINNLLVGTASLLSSKAHAVRDEGAQLPVIARMHEEALRSPLVNHHVQDIPDAVCFLLRRDPHDDEAFQLIVKMAAACQEYYSLHRHVPGIAREFYGPRAMYLSAYILPQYERSGDVHTEWLERRIERALEEKDISFFDFLLNTELPLVAIDFHAPRAALQTLELCVHRDLPQMQEYIDALLSRMRLYYPDEVDDFMEEHVFADERQLKIRANQPFETVSALISYKFWVFLENDVLAESASLRAVLARILAQAADHPSLRSWIDCVIREVVNLVYGEEVLPAPAVA